MAQHNRLEQLRFGRLPNMVPATAQAPYSTAGMNFRSASREVLREDFPFLLRCHRALSLVPRRTLEDILPSETLYAKNCVH